MDDDQQPGMRTPLPIGVALFKLAEPETSLETIALLETLLHDAQASRVIGLAVVSLHTSGSFDLQLRGAASEEGNQMGVAGMLAALQKMVLELY